MNNELKRLDKRTRVAIQLKTDITYLSIQQRIAKKRYLVQDVDMDKIVKGAAVYYFLKSQDYDVKPGISYYRLINHIRHNYTNYSEFISILEETRGIPSVYRVSILEMDIYKKFRGKFDKLIIEKYSDKIKEELGENE